MEIAINFMEQVKNRLNASLPASLLKSKQSSSKKPIESEVRMNGKFKINQNCYRSDKFDVEASSEHR